jgi:large subunit ribosomal protein L32
MEKRGEAGYHPALYLNFTGDREMALPKRKSSKSRTRRTKAENMKRSLNKASLDAESGAPSLPHRVCPSTGKYRGRQVITVSDE